MNRQAADGVDYIDSPTGIVTAAGTHFKTTEKLLQEFAAPVFAHEPLSRLISKTEVWAQSPVTVSLWALPILLLLLPVWVAATIALFLFGLWRIFSPSVPVRAGITVLAILQKPAVQGVFYVVALTALGWSGRTPAVLVGLAGFISLRFGLIDVLLKPILAPALDRLYALPVPDQVLRAVIIRAALRHSVLLAGFSGLEESARAAWNVRRKK